MAKLTPRSMLMWAVKGMCGVANMITRWCEEHGPMDYDQWLILKEELDKLATVPKKESGR